MVIPHPLRHPMALAPAIDACGMVHARVPVVARQEWEAGPRRTQRQEIDG